MAALSALAAAAAAFIVGRKKGTGKGPGKGPENVVELAQGTSTDPMAYGTKAQVQSLLDEYGAYLEEQGVNLDWFSPTELTLLHKTGKYAIPPKHLWDEMARTIVGVAQPIRNELGAPLRIYNGYRPRWYNEQVGGADESLHIRNAALDLIPTDYSKRKQLAQIAAKFAKDNGERLKLGMGIYNYPNMTGLHVDALVRTRFTPYVSTRQWMKTV